MMNSAHIMKISLDESKSKAAIEVEQRLFEHYGLQVRSHYVELKQTPIRVRVLEAGSGQPIIMVPGGEGAAYQWAALMAQLKDRRLIVINRPGAALSDFVDHRQVDLRQLAVDMLTSVMDAFGLDNAPIVCNSMGGLWSFWFALARPERVTRIVQAGCPALILNTSAPMMMRLMSVPGLNQLLIGFMVPKDVNAALEVFKMLGSNSNVIQAQPKILGEVMCVLSRLPTYKDCWRTLFEAVLTPFGAKAQYQFREDSLRQIQIPTLFIWGDNDPFGGLDVAHKVAEIMPNAQLQELSAGHLPYIDQPEACGKLIREFLNS